MRRAVYPVNHPLYRRRMQALRRLQVWQLTRPYICRTSPRRLQVVRALEVGGVADSTYSSPRRYRA